MPTERQVMLIEELLDETGLDRGDLSDEDEAWGTYERLGADDASELIDFLIDETKMMRK